MRAVANSSRASAQHPTRFSTSTGYLERRRVMAFNQEEFINHLSGLTVVELVQLTKALEDKWGVKAAPVAVAAAPAAGGGAAPAAAAEEKTEFTVGLKARGAHNTGLTQVPLAVTGLRLNG